jgi:thiosulfate dehydrogenase
MKYAAGFILGLIVLPLCGYLYLTLGLVPVATSAPPMPFEQYFAEKALHARISREAPTTDAIQATEPNFLAGANVYKQNCAVCHGLPGQPKSHIAQGMFPPPPQLFQGTGVTDDPAGVTYWKVKNGIRLTGMPGFGWTLSNEQMWQVSTLLANANKVPPSVTQALQQP